MATHFLQIVGVFIEKQQWGLSREKNHLRFLFLEQKFDFC
jgi:hypothetical protein